MAGTAPTPKLNSEKELTRRGVVIALPLAGMTASAQASSGGGDTPILRLFHRHQALMDAADAHVKRGGGDDCDARMQADFYNEADAIEAELLELPSTCAADFAAKAIIFTNRGEHLPYWDASKFWDEARALTAPAA